jgi:hypothetical protein
MKNDMNIKSLSREESMIVNGGEMTKSTSAAYDLFYIVGITFRGVYEFITGAAAYQASLPPNLKK